MKRILKGLVGAVSWLFIVLPLLLILLTLAYRVQGEAPELMGRSIYVIASQSMEPELKVGDLILSKSYRTGDSLKEGDVITYLGSSGEYAGKRITHRLVRLDRDGDGQIQSLTARGLANAADDPAITEDAVLSVMRCRIPGGRLLYRLLSSTLGFLLLFFIPMGMFILSEAKGLIREIKDEGYENEGSVTPDSRKYEEKKRGKSNREDTAEQP